MELRHTSRYLSYSEIGKEINWNLPDNVALIRDLSAFIHKYNINPDNELLLSESSLFWWGWLKNRPTAQQFLIDKHFAYNEEEQEREFRPFTLKIETKEEAQVLWHRLAIEPTEFEKSCGPRGEEVEYPSDPNIGGPSAKIFYRLEDKFNELELWTLLES